MEDANKLSNWLKKLARADVNKKSKLWFDEMETKQFYYDEKIKAIILSMPGEWKLRSREVEGRNIIDAIWEKYGNMAAWSVLECGEPIFLGLQAIMPERVYAAFTHDMDSIVIKESTKRGEL